jgi:hypothetical protein
MRKSIKWQVLEEKSLLNAPSAPARVKTAGLKKPKTPIRVIPGSSGYVNDFNTEVSLESTDFKDALLEKHKKRQPVIFAKVAKTRYQDSGYSKIHTKFVFNDFDTPKNPDTQTHKSQYVLYRARFLP